METGKTLTVHNDCVKLQLLLSIAFPVHLSKNIDCKKEDKKTTSIFEMRCFRRILAVKWQDRRTNEEMRTVVGLQRKDSGGRAECIHSWWIQFE